MICARHHAIARTVDIQLGPATRNIIELTMCVRLRVVVGEIVETRGTVR